MLELLYDQPNTCPSTYGRLVLDVLNNKKYTENVRTNLDRLVYCAANPKHHCRSALQNIFTLLAPYHMLLGRWLPQPRLSHFSLIPDGWLCYNQRSTMCVAAVPEMWACCLRSPTSHYVYAVINKCYVQKGYVSQPYDISLAIVTWRSIWTRRTVVVLLIFAFMVSAISNPPLTLPPRTLPRALPPRTFLSPTACHMGSSDLTASNASPPIVCHARSSDLTAPNGPLSNCPSLGL